MNPHGCATDWLPASRHSQRECPNPQACGFAVILGVKATETCPATVGLAVRHHSRNRKPMSSKHLQTIPHDMAAGFISMSAVDS